MFLGLRRSTVGGENVVGTREDETTHGNNIAKTRLQKGFAGSGRGLVSLNLWFGAKVKVVIDIFTRAVYIPSKCIPSAIFFIDLRLCCQTILEGI